MKKKHLIGTLLVSILVFFLSVSLAYSSCLSGWSKKTKPDLSCSNNNINSMLTSGEYQKKVDNFIIIQDASSTMGEKASRSSHYYSKLEESKDLLNCLNNSLPDNFDVDAGMRGFGPFYSEKGLIYGMTDYSKDGFDSAISSFGKTGGVTPLANAITYGGYDLLNTPGLKDMPRPTAMILFSDGLNTDASNPAAAAAAIQEMYGSNICIYTVLLGNDPKGKVTMEQISDAGKCGYATDSAAIASAQGMDKFVTDVFLKKAPPKPKPAPVPAPVMQKPVEKISITLFIEFDFDKDVVRPQHHGDVKKIADTLNKYSEATVELEGHTDSMGTDAYNMDLSKRRADNVKKYLVDKFNVKASRISTVGYGESKPIASNDTAAGMQRNRRVVANIE
jgi:OOP family OmpA-OmpF porin